VASTLAATRHRPTLGENAVMLCELAGQREFRFEAGPLPRGIIRSVRLLSSPTWKGNLRLP
jgi:hypothetical protein